MNGNGPERPRFTSTGRPPTEDERLWDARAAAMRRDAPVLLEKEARRWAAGLAGFLGLVGLSKIAVPASAETTDVWGCLAYWLTVAGAIAAAVALAISYFTAFPTPRMGRASGAGLKKHSHDRAATIQKRLPCVKALAAAAFVSTVVAGFLPVNQEDSTDGLFSYETETGEICGDIEVLAGRPAIVSDTSVLLLPAAAELTAVADCD